MSPKQPVPEALDLDHRRGWPEELAYLLKRYPREIWREHENLGQMARFWLARHGMFRDLGGALTEGMSRFRDGKLDYAAFSHWFAPRLQFFLGELDGHHQIEDRHYFPVFAAAEAKLARGFDVLEGDHEIIHDDLYVVSDTAITLLRAGEGDALRRAADAYVDANDRLIRRLLRHLEDEEDLIVPLILDRGEQALGV